MTKEELKTLHELLMKLRLERENEIVSKAPYMKQVFEDNDLDTVYDYDDGDRLIEGIDIVMPVVEWMSE